MNTKMTERDKKLLIFLAFFIVIVGFGYWGIRPLAKSIMEYNDSIEEQKLERDLTELKLMELPIIVAENEELEGKIVEARKDFYPMMTSDEIDKLFTGMALDYNLYAYDLDITMPDSEAVIAPYMYSKKSLEVDDTEEYEDVDSEGKSKDALDQIDEAVGDISDEEEEDTSSESGIYSATISMRLGGDRVMLQKLIDDLSLSDKKHLVKDYSWETSDSNSIVFSDGEYNVNVVSSTYINITLDIYMCEE